MIFNETVRSALLVSEAVADPSLSQLPIVAEEPLGGGLQATIVSIVLVIIFAEIVCVRKSPSEDSVGRG